MVAGAIRKAYLGLLRRADEGDLLARARAENAWFVEGQVAAALESMVGWFEGEGLEKVVEEYAVKGEGRRIGIIMAGNVPLVGLHDLLAVLLTGHVAVVKPSHKDRVLIEAFVAELPEGVRERVVWRERLGVEEIDFLLATGSGNTARQLDHDFAGVERLIRRNRWSVGVLRGDESGEELAGLVGDVLLYHGMGCRSVCNVIGPVGYDWGRLGMLMDMVTVPALSAEWELLLNWERGVAEMVGGMMGRSERVLMEVRNGLSAARPGVLHVVEAKAEAVPALLESVQEQLQCVVGRGYLPFGTAQSPGLNDFADGVDTFALLSGLGPRRG